MPTPVDTALAMLHDAIRASQYERAHIPADTPTSYDETHDGVEVIVCCDLDDALPVSIELYERDGDGGSVVAELDLTAVAAIRDTLTAILIAAGEQI